jgi:hypothetical protein
MSSLSDIKRTLRERSEHQLRVAVLSELGRGQPSTTEPYQEQGGRFWKQVFVPVYRRVPWSTKEKAMGALGMTAKGWKAPERKPREPWRPPPNAADVLQAKAAQPETRETSPAA